jgi:hypothetical protein
MCEGEGAKTVALPNKRETTVQIEPFYFTMEKDMKFVRNYVHGKLLQILSVPTTTFDGLTFEENNDSSSPSKKYNIDKWNITNVLINGMNETGEGFKNQNAYWTVFPVDA